VNLDDWSRALAPDETVVPCDGDAELAARAGDAQVLHASTGDIHRSLGGPTLGRATTAVALDLIDCRVDCGRFRAAAHVVCRPARRLGAWRGSLILVMVSGHLGPFEPAPRAHPGDGLLDIVEVDRRMSPRQRLMARRRARLGAHLPHPDISTTRVRDLRRSFAEPMTVVVDGRAVGATTHLDVAVVAAAYEFAV